MSRTLRLAIFAGETSGDIHAAALVRALRSRADVELWGMGGPRMREAGVRTIADTGELAVMGFSDVLARLPFFARLFRRTVRLIEEKRPDAIVLVDYPGFNMRLAGWAHRRGLRVIYYICPQVWAWHRSRMRKLARDVDTLLTIFPFEKPLFDGTGLEVEFVGHPLVDEIAAELRGPCEGLNWEGDPRVALLPGSRIHVVGKNLPAMWKAAAAIEAANPGASFAVAAADEAGANFIDSMLKKMPNGPSRFRVATGMTRQALRLARAALVCSGTATVEAALLGCPMAVVYRMGAVSYLLARRLVRVNHIGMVNIIAGERLCPEFVQNAAEPDALAAAVQPWLRDGPEREAMLRGLQRVADALGPPGASERAAAIILRNLER